MNLLKFSQLLFAGIRGATATPDLPVLAGLDAVVKLDGKIIAWATNLSFDEDFELQGIRTLGYHGDRGYKSQGYNCSVTVGTFVLIGTIGEALPVPTRKTILTSGVLDFEVMDLNTNKTLYVLGIPVEREHDVALPYGHPAGRQRELKATAGTWR